MILVDPATGSGELLPVIQKFSVPCKLEPLPFGDVCFTGNGPKGTIGIGIERKKIHDILACINDARFSGHQLPGLLNMYKVRYLYIEQFFYPNSDGMLRQSIDGSYFFLRKPPTQYDRLYRYLLSVNLAGVSVIFTRDIYQTAYNICATYWYFQKEWDKHDSLKRTQDIFVPTADPHPPLVQKWAKCIDGVGDKLCTRAAQLFKTPYDLANADPSDWMMIPGISEATAEDIVNQIMGVKR